MEKTATNYSQWTQQIINGGIVGGVCVTVVTPIMNFTNHTINHLKSGKTSFKWVRAFEGLPAYLSSVVPMVGISVTFHRYLSEKYPVEKNKNAAPAQLMISTLSGALAGFAGSLPEAVAQAQQIKTNDLNLKPSTIIQQVYKNNGFFALGRGVTATMARQGCFTLGYLGLMPMFSSKLRAVVPNHWVADLISALVCGLIVGPATAPFNVCRYEKQKGFILPSNPPSYKQILQDNQGKLMSGVRPRTLMTFVSMFMLFKGNEFMNTKDENLGMNTK